MSVTPDGVIELRKLWSDREAGEMIPEATVLAGRDWLAYVHAMKASMPTDADIVFPTETDVNWAWPNGLLLIPADPIEVLHPAGRRHSVAGIVIWPLVERDDSDSEHLVAWIGTDPDDSTEDYWVPGEQLPSDERTPTFDSTRLLIAMITALGHRLTRIVEPRGSGRGERRRIARELPALRVLELASGASVKVVDGDGKVEWSHRWMVRGHWRLQPYGAEGKLRRLQWIDPYVKGPEDKPLDVRPTIWRTA